MEKSKLNEQEPQGGANNPGEGGGNHPLEGALGQVLMISEMRNRLKFGDIFNDSLQNVGLARSVHSTRISDYFLSCL